MTHRTFRELQAASGVTILQHARKRFKGLDNWHILLAIIECHLSHKPCSARAIARATGLSRSTLARHLDYLLKQEWVVREHSRQLRASPEIEVAVFMEIRRRMVIHADELVSGPK